MSTLSIAHHPPRRVEAHGRNARAHSPKQFMEIAASIKRFAKQLGLASAQTIRLEHVTDAEKRAYILAATSWLGSRDPGHRAAEPRN